jgi:hypothetical protein
MRRQNIHAIAHLHARPDKTDELSSLLKASYSPGAGLPPIRATAESGDPNGFCGGFTVG